MIRYFQYFPLCLRLLQMFLLNQVLLPHTLHSKILFGSFSLTQHDFAEGPTSEYFEELELFECGDIGGGVFLED